MCQRITELKDRGAKVGLFDSAARRRVYCTTASTPGWQSCLRQSTAAQVRATLTSARGRRADGWTYRLSPHAGDRGAFDALGVRLPTLWMALHSKLDLAGAKAASNRGLVLRLWVTSVGAAAKS